MERHHGIVLLSGGVGVTPTISMCEHIARNPQKYSKLSKLWVLWSTRSDAQSLFIEDMLTPLLQAIASSGIDVRFELYHTHGKKPTGVFSSSSQRAVLVGDEDKLLGSPLNQEPTVDTPTETDAKKPASWQRVHRSTHHTRMNLPTILSSIIAAVDREPLLDTSGPAGTAVAEALGLYLCGPPPMMKSANEAAAQLGRFEVHNETFLL
jgi:predicted ferric reductase